MTDTTTDAEAVAVTENAIPEPPDPFALFDAWYKEAESSEPNDPNAMALATVDGDGLPTVRMMLLKGVDAGGFVFFTNSESRKGCELAGQAKAALCLHWKSLRRQVRVRGLVEQVSAAEADAYFATRPRGSQIGAWASSQSRPLASRSELAARVHEVEQRHEGADVPRPPHWNGYRVQPESIEFWMDRQFRLHERLVYIRKGEGWETSRLYP